jgi:hypothetical protein
VGYCPVAWVCGPTRQSERGDLGVLPLVPQASIEGRVVDVAGDPVAHAQVHAVPDAFDGVGAYLARLPARWSESLPPGNLRFQELLPPAETDADGAFRLLVTPSTTAYALSTSRDDYLAGTEEGIVVATPRGSECVEIVLARGARVSGWLVRNGLDWSGELGWDRPGVRGKRSVLVRGGRYELENLEPGPIRVFVESAITKEVVAEAALEVRAEGVYRQDLSWTEAVQTIAGQVVDARGAPVRHAVVGVRRSTSRKPRDLSTKSGLGGRFELEVPPDETFVVTATDRVVRTEVADVPAGASDVMLVLGGSGSLTVQLLDARSGEPVVPPSLRFLAWAPPQKGSFRRLKAKSSPDGVARVELPAGRIELEVDLSPLGYVPEIVPDVVITGQGVALTVELERGFDVRFAIAREHVRELRGHAVFLIDRDRPDTLRGPSPGEDGDPFVQVDGLRLWAHRTVLKRRRLSFGADGRAQLEALAPGAYVLRCFPEDVSLEPSAILLGTADQSIDLSLYRR